MKRVAVAMGAGPALAAGSAQAIVIDNGIPVGIKGHWSVDVLTGGAIDNVVYTVQQNNSTNLITENVVTRSSVFVDPGNDGQGFELRGSPPVLTGTTVGTNTVTSSGTFIGANGNTIEWQAVSTTTNGNTALYEDCTFHTDGGPIGPLRIYKYLDAGIQGSSDVLQAYIAHEAFGAEHIVLSTFDSVERFGVAQEAYNVLNRNSTLQIAGAAADISDQIVPRIMDAGQPVSFSYSQINLPPLANFTQPGLPVYGPTDIASVVAWDVLPTNFTGIHSVLYGREFLPPPPPPPPPPPTAPPDDPEECEIEFDTDTCEGPVAPVRRKFSCQGNKCDVEIACNLTTECVGTVKIFVTPPTKSRMADREPRRILFASTVSAIPPGTTATLKPRLTKRGKTIRAANRRKSIKGVMQITNAGTLVTSVPVRIKIK